MQTNREYFTSLTVPVLKSILADFNATGYSKMRKAELVNFILPLMDGAHLDAEKESRTRVTRKIATGYKLRKSYNERMVNRLFGYHTQNGHAHMLSVESLLSYDSPLMLSTLTPKQRKRFNKKYNRHYRQLNATFASL